MKKLTYQPRISTASYQFSHGKQPRGYGFWVFRIGDGEVFFSGYYAKAAANAIKHAKAKNIFDIEVLP